MTFIPATLRRDIRASRRQQAWAAFYRDKFETWTIVGFVGGYVVYAVYVLVSP